MVNREASNKELKTLGRKLRHDRRRARQRAKRKEGVFSLRNEHGIVDPTPHVASKDSASKGRYRELGKGFAIDDR